MKTLVKKCKTCGVKAKQAHKPTCPRSKQYVDPKQQKLPLSNPKKSIIDNIVNNTPKKNIVNYITFILDASGSMQHLYRTVQVKMEEQIREISELAIRSNQLTYVSVVTFSDSIVRTLDKVNVLKYKVNFASEHYPALMMNTALFDAIGKECVYEASYNNNEVANLFVIYTDGHENSSRTWNKTTLSERIKNLNCSGNVTFVVNCPPGSKKTIEGLGIPIENIREWEGTQKGFTEATYANTGGIIRYMNERELGLSSTKTFFQTDTTVIDKQKLAILPDTVTNYKHWKVDRECPIQSFIESKGLAFETGRSFYALTKKEKVASHKHILVKDKQTGKLYDTPNIRSLLKMPTGDLDLEPGNHENYIIYVQSHSNNRKLVRGTDILYKK